MTKAAFTNTTFNGAIWHTTDQVLDVFTPHGLSQAAGYLKFANAKDGGVYYRGQCARYGKMVPSLYRDLTRVMNIRQASLKTFVAETVNRRAFLGNTPKYAQQPILQHYGIRTNWLDIVDNVWTALWFACNKAIATGRLGEYLHFLPSESEFVFIELIQVGFETPDVSRPGWWSTPDCYVIDLRRAAPSLYLRPHAQHGLLVRRRSYPSISSVDLSDHIVGTIRIRTEVASRWIGLGEFSKTSTMFPSPTYDSGYLSLLNRSPAGNKQVGSIQHVGA